MKSRFEKNFTDQGYLMNYEKPGSIAYLNNHVFQFRVELQEISPLIWRRIHVPSDYNFWDLHVAIQDSMGWLDYHLHHFEIRGKGKRKKVQIGIPDFDRMDELEEVYPGWEILILAYFNDLGVEAKYIYDYGDFWQHTVKLEGYMYKEKGIKYPLCIDGERACPPEDCGGIMGYNNVIETLSDPKNTDYEDMKNWAGENWNPERFNTNDVKFDNPYKRWKTAFLER
ncbi:MAG: plasmid pRiA4b ORF-3 family protein [Bacteroidales bacterium]|nr:plasmid pRiA4b ORF-3 family protein [Bacteroidales bacterium]